ncbi:type II toxin-antitoxin system HicB family antitoxin [Archaeoglobus sp.]
MIEIFYSEEDEEYIAVVPELPGCSAFGETPEEALKEVKIAIELWIKAAKEMGKDIPKPMGKELLKEIVEKMAKI